MSDKENIENLRKMASRIRERKLNVPVSFLFESHIPAFNILYSIFLCTEPFMIPFVSSDARNFLHDLYQDPEMKDVFISELNKEAQ